MTESDRNSRLIVLPAEATALRRRCGKATLVFGRNEAIRLVGVICVISARCVVGAVAQNRLPILDAKSPAVGIRGFIRKSGGRGTKDRGQGESDCGFSSALSYLLPLVSCFGSDAATSRWHRGRLRALR